MDKAREFSVAETLDGQVHIYREHRAGLTRFIEYSAFETLQARVQELEASNRDYWQEIERLRGALDGLTGVDSIKSVTDDGEEEWWLSAQEISMTVDEVLSESIQRFGESKKGE